MIYARSEPLLMADDIAYAGFPQVSNLSVIGAGAGAATVVDEAGGVSIASNNTVAVVLAGTYPNVHAEVTFFLTGKDPAQTHQSGLFLRGSVSGSNTSGYMLFGNRINASPGAIVAQPRVFTGAGANASNTLTGNITLPGDAADYVTEIVHMEAEIVGTAWQARTWLDTEARPAWQAGGADITFLTSGGGTLYHATGQHGFIMSLVGGATVHLRHLLAREIGGLSDA